MHVSIHAPARGATSRPARSTAIGIGVSIHAPARGATAARWHADRDRERVSIHAPARGATRNARCSRRSDLVFQSTPPRGGRRTSRRQICDAAISFNPRPRAGGDVTVHGNRWTWHRCFNPRPRAGGDDSARVQQHAVTDVSIHAPARGATRRPGQRPSCQWRFNPRPRAGGDTRWQTGRAIAELFQSTPPRGGRLESSRAAWIRAGVSIHAPARGATIIVATLASPSASFNPRPRAGGDDRPTQSCDA